MGKTPRSRGRITYGPKGTVTRFGSLNGGFSVPVLQESCDDIRGPGDCDPLTITRNEISGGVINSPNDNFFAPYFNNYRCDFADNWGQVSHLSFTDDLPSDSLIATQAAARTNPSRPSVGVISNLLELGDIVRLMRDTVFQLRKDAYRARRSFRGAFRAGGNSWLLGLFGVAPLIRDLKSISQFAELYIQRCKEVKKLQTSNGLRRTIDFGVYSTKARSAKVVQSNWGGFISTTFDVNTVQRIRAHTRWMPDVTFNDAYASGDMARQVRNAVLGAEVNLSSLWDGLPWSWLVNWAYDVGSFQRARLNIIPAYLSGVHVMRHTRTTWSCPFYTDGRIRMSPLTMTLESKTRKPSSVSPTAHFPLLSGSDMGILAALGTKWL